MRTLLAAIWILGIVALIYVPDCGLGFIKDDFGWLASSQLHGWASAWRLFQGAPMGFYRPLVSLSFGANRLAFGLDPLPYGLTNLTLAIATAGAIWWLIVRLGFSREISLFAAAVWLLNFHGIALAVQWTSGRTSLLATLFAVAAACAFTASRPLLCGVLTFLALLSKEEPLFLPVTFLLWLGIDRALANPVSQAGDRRAGWSVAASAIAVGLYLLIRAGSHALTPWSAPDFYRYRLSVIPLNALHYADRSLTLTVSLILLGACFVDRRALTLTPLERSTIFRGVAWLGCGFALTIMIPVRSSLYVCLPAVGSSLILAGAASAEWRAIHRRRPAVVVGLLLLPLAFLPVYRARNRELTLEQRLSTNAWRVITSHLAGRPVRRLIVYDGPVHHPSMRDAFGDTLPIALQLSDPTDTPTDVVISLDAVPSADAGPDTLELVLAGTTLVER